MRATNIPLEHICFRSFHVCVRGPVTVQCTVYACMGGGGGLLLSLACMGMCRWTGYGFWSLCPEQGMVTC